MTFKTVIQKMIRTHRQVEYLMELSKKGKPNPNKTVLQAFYNLIFTSFASFTFTIQSLLNVIKLKTAVHLFKKNRI